METIECLYRLIGYWVIRLDLFLVILLFIAGFFFLIKRPRFAKRLTTFVCLAFICIGTIPFGLWMVEALENRFPKVTEIPHDAKGIIYLGGSFDKRTSEARSEIAFNLTAGKLIRFIELARTYPDLKLVATGTAFEATALKKQLLALGIDPERVVYEDSSKDTKDNAQLTAALLKPKPGEKWVLLTSAYHMPRSVGLFRNAGFTIIPYPTDYHTPGNFEPFFFLGLKINLDGWYAASREWLGMFANYFMGRSDTIYPAP